MRSNAPKERQLVFMAIEMISSTKTARLTGRGAKLLDIKFYTNLHRVAIDAALKWLYARGAIKKASKNQWFVRELPTPWCWEHGIFPSALSPSGCRKCEEKAIITRETL